MTDTARPELVLDHATLPEVRHAFMADVMRSSASEREPEVSGSLRVHRPASGGVRGRLLTIHGGGYVLGAAAMQDRLCEHWANTQGWLAASVEYPLAPESSATAMLDACERGLEELRALDATGPLVVFGDSAGGGLAAGLAVRGCAMDALMLVQPMLDPRTGGRRDPGHSWHADHNRFGWAARLGGSEPTPETAPALAEDLGHFPPTWIGIGTRDLFLRENLAFAAKLAEAHVDVTLETYSGAVHAFQRLHADRPAAARWRSDRDGWLRERLER